jgi:DDE superfamily endonuclease
MTNRKIEDWVIPPEADAEFAASMEEGLDVYARPYDSRCPVLCRDEQPIQLLKETRNPIPGTKKHPRRVDYEYERAGTASIFMSCEPRLGWRHVSVRARRTKVDWAQEVEELLRTRSASAGKVTFVSDNLNTHTKGAFYETFEPQTARSLVRRLEFCHTPKHGSWLNIAENELSSMTRQSITGRRFGTGDEVRQETTPWCDHRNARQRSVDWQFKVDHARLKLKSVYPKLEV